MSIIVQDHASEIAAGQRFGFGANWERFLRLLDEDRIKQAEVDLCGLLEMPSLQGKRFLDIGSGSGLSSLAAWRRGAQVLSFDYDPQSCACTTELKRRYGAPDSAWTVRSGSVLDPSFLSGLGQWDVVYSWGVLHHTGHMWDALEGAAARVAAGGSLFIAIYNDQGPPSRRWLAVKKAYCALPRPLKAFVLIPAMLRLWGPTVLRDAMRGRPLHSWRNYAGKGFRGMDPWRDAVDWVGGLPFEVASPEAIFDFHRKRGFTLQRMTTCAGGLGCNQFVFVKEA